MNKSTVGYLLLLVILGLTDFSGKVSAFAYDKLRAEGVIGFYIQDVPPAPPLPEPITVDCTCNGTKKLTTDGRILIDCPCGEGCTCKKKSGDMPITANKQILFFGAEWCSYCKVFERNEFPKLKDLGFVISDAENAQIRVIDIDKQPDLYQKYGKNRPLPLIILLKDGVEAASVLNKNIPAKASSVIELNKR